ncbi:MAG: PhzF family phenazine biosynthesis protein [Asgard group archaeon]|nr:PhzF family phenazine biosynthesis protein [Asgard group archaeon]
MRKIPFLQTSVFTDDNYDFSGNQLATFYAYSTIDKLTSKEMLGITREMNFSESTFLFPPTIDECIVKVRIFTPAQEINFAGHPTLGTAFVMKELDIIKQEMTKTNLELGIGCISVDFLEDGTVGMYQQKPQFLEKYTDYENMQKILGLEAEHIDKKASIQIVTTGFPFLIVPIVSLEAIEQISLDPRQLEKTLKEYNSQEIVTFTTETIHKENTVHARMFAPLSGVFEDPATGSAAGPLCAYLEHTDYLEDHTSGENIYIEQGHEMNRPSKLIAKTIISNEKITQVHVSGKVKLTAKGKFYLS